MAEQEEMYPTQTFPWPDHKSRANLAAVCYMSYKRLQPSECAVRQTKRGVLNAELNTVEAVQIPHEDPIRLRAPHNQLVN